MKRLKDNKVVKIIRIIFNVIVGAFFVLFLLAVGLQRISDNKLAVYKFRLFTVASGSMVPEYKIGDVLISKEVDISSIKKGDNITYLGASGTFKDKVVTHEVIDIEKKDGKTYFHTKGKANLIEDPLVEESQVYGKVVYKPFLLSFVSRSITTKIGMLLFIIVPVFYIVGSEMIITMLEKEAKRRNQE